MIVTYLIECMNGEKCPDETAHALGESESVHFAHVQRHIFTRCGPYNIFQKLEHPFKYLMVCLASAG